MGNTQQSGGGSSGLTPRSTSSQHAATTGPGGPPRSPNYIKKGWGEGSQQALAPSPVGNLESMSPSLHHHRGLTLTPISPPALSPAGSPVNLPSPAVSSASEASSAGSFFGDESFFETIQAGWHRRKVEQRRKRLNIVGTYGRACHLKLNTIEILQHHGGLSSAGTLAAPVTVPGTTSNSSSDNGGETAAIRIQLVEVTAEGAARVVWERQTPDAVVRPGVMCLSSSSFFLPYTTCKHVLVLSLLVDGSLLDQARFRLEDVHSTVQPTYFNVRSSNGNAAAGGKNSHKELSGGGGRGTPVSSRTPVSTIKHTAGSKTPTSKAAPPPPFAMTPRRHHQQNHPQQHQQQQPAGPFFLATGTLDFSTHFSSASTWMDSWSDGSLANQSQPPLPPRLLIVLGKQLTMWRDLNDAAPIVHELSSIEEVCEGDFHLARRTLVVKVRCCSSLGTDTSTQPQQHQHWTLVPPSDREFLHWYQLLQTKLYEVRYSGLPVIARGGDEPYGVQQDES